MTTLRPSGVAVNTNLLRQQGLGGTQQPMLGNGMVNANGMNVMQSAADMIRGTLSSALSNNGQQSGGFNWGRGGGGLVYDDALKSLSGSADDTNNPDNDNFYTERVAPGMVKFIRELASRAGTFFEQYKQVRDNFRNVERFGQLQPDPVMSAFIDEVTRQGDITRIIGFTAAPMFGFNLVQILKNLGPNGEFSQQNYLESGVLAVRNALYFELINWLMNSQKGREMIPLLSKEVKGAIDQLQTNKDVSSLAYEFFGQTLPWAHLEFKVPKNTQPNYAQMFSASNGYPDTGVDYSGARAAEPDQMMMNESLALVMRNANLRQKALVEGRIQPSQTNSASPYVGEIPVEYNTSRKDWENINPLNRDEFRPRRLFHNMGKENLYFIAEGDWKRVKNGYRKNPEQEAEETVVKGCFRVVYIDLDKDTGWTSTVVRAENYTMPQVLSDPSKLLPLMDTPDASDFLTVNTYSISEVAKPGSLEVPVETVEKLGKGILVFTVPEPIVSESSQKLEKTVINANDATMTSVKGEAATTFNVSNWDKYTCTSESDRTLLYVKAPYLFKDGDLSDEKLPKSFYQQVIQLANLAENHLVDDALMQMIEQYLTAEVNSWLTNIGGFDVKGRNVLKVENIFDDIRQLNDYLKEHDRELAGVLHDVDKPSALKRAMAYFVYDHSARIKNTDQDSLLADAEEELDLHAQRQMFMAVVNNRTGPAVEPDGNPVTIKRSRFPEYFDLVEKAFPGTMGLELDFEEVDKVFLFKDSNNLWLFNYSAIDRNVATLRQISRRSQLVSMQFS